MNNTFIAEIRQSNLETFDSQLHIKNKEAFHHTLPREGIESFVFKTNKEVNKKTFFQRKQKSCRILLNKRRETIVFLSKAHTPFLNISFN